MSVLADWLARQAPAWLDGAHPITPAARRALHAIRRCRTPELGGHVYRCTDCTKTDYAYHSFHHRACPRCGGARTAEWTARQTERLLPVPYFLVTFTVPEEMRPIFSARPGVLHDLFFTQAARALQTVAAIPRHLGAELGCLGVLHTWGRQLQYHPHLHFIVPGGGLTADHQTWRHSRQPDWLLPKDAVAAALRQGFSEALRHAAPDLHAQVSDACWRDGWWGHWQPAGSGDAARQREDGRSEAQARGAAEGAGHGRPRRGQCTAQNVVKYLARYVSRTAISDERIVTATEDSVTFRYTDSQTQERRECPLTAAAFMQRYLQHVLPPGQHRVRYFGWMHPAAKKRRLIVETLLAVPIIMRPKVDTPEPWHLRCPHCGGFTLVCVGRIPRSPPACDR